MHDVEEGVPGSYTIARCSRCNLVFLSRRPVESALPECYGDNYHVLAAWRHGGFSGWLYNLRYHFRYRSIRSYLAKDSIRILEIGCGDAMLLIALEKVLGNRCELVGLDYSIAGVALPAGSKIKLLQGDVRTAPIEGTFDIILLYDVLEHLADPVGSLGHIRCYLKTNGVLIGQVPNWNSLWRRVFSRWWSGLQVPRHMSFFTAATLRKTLEKAGFASVSFCRVFDPGDLSVSVCNWLVDRCHWRGKPRHLKIYIPLTMAAAPIVALQNIFGDSGEIVFEAKLHL
ncbi:MAG: class I SAM-dependent methyltransferase [Kiritimatiellaeota bacterium]|nr:class I SAM-dependent methyltransferase [Kiritimatiellota bacterium]